MTLPELECNSRDVYVLTRINYEWQIVIAIHPAMPFYQHITNIGFEDGAEEQIETCNWIEVFSNADWIDTEITK